MATRIFTGEDGLRAVDLIHCAMDHLSAAELLFRSGPHLYDSAGYLAHLGIEMLLKGWLLDVNGSFEGVHSLSKLHGTLVTMAAAQPLKSRFTSTLKKLDVYEKLRYPNLLNPAEVGEDDWGDIELLAGELCGSMPNSIEQELAKINADSSLPVRKAGRVLMKRKKRSDA